MRLRALLASAAVLLAAPALLAADPIPGIRSSGTIVAQINLQGQPINVGGNIAFFHKGSLYRLDLLSLGIPGTSGDLSALAATLIGPGGASFVYDSASGTTTAWSNANRTFYSETPSASGTRPPGSRPSATSAATAASAGAGDPLASLANVAAILRNVQSASIQLVGHSPVNGHPATNLDLQLRRQLPGKPAESYHAQLALADDLDDFPVQIVLQSTPPTSSSIGGTVKLDLTNVQPDSPDDAMFRAPAGYRRVDSLGGVLGRSLPGS
ncbi:MAG TPA: hypothetical protein VHT53_04215 [Candidatus Elarobacter sp.]|jgi:hypothetical protein|nr:hypothetical protein [Candidatus Elarobacter sp.]